MVTSPEDIILDQKKNSFCYVGFSNCVLKFIYPPLIFFFFVHLPYLKLDNNIIPLLPEGDGFCSLSIQCDAIRSEQFENGHFS